MQQHQKKWLLDQRIHEKQQMKIKKIRKTRKTNILTKYSLPIKSDLTGRGKRCHLNNTKIDNITIMIIITITIIRMEENNLGWYARNSVEPLIQGVKAAETTEYINIVTKKEFKQSWMREKKEL